jgi:hypothetical protein
MLKTEVNYKNITSFHVVMTVFLSLALAACGTAKETKNVRHINNNPPNSSKPVSKPGDKPEAETASNQLSLILADLISLKQTERALDLVLNQKSSKYLNNNQVVKISKTSDSKVVKMNIRTNEDSGNSYRLGNEEILITFKTEISAQRIAETVISQSLPLPKDIASNIAKIEIENSQGLQFRIEQSRLNSAIEIDLTNENLVISLNRGSIFDFSYSGLLKVETIPSGRTNARETKLMPSRGGRLQTLSTLSSSGKVDFLSESPTATSANNSSAVLWNVASVSLIREQLKNLEQVSKEKIALNLVEKSNSTSLVFAPMLCGFPVGSFRAAWANLADATVAGADSKLAKLPARLPESDSDLTIDSRGQLTLSNVQQKLNATSCKPGFADLLEIILKGERLSKH